MFSLFIIGFFCYLSYHVSLGTHKQKKVFIEFGQRTTIFWLVWLIPLGAMIVTFLSTYFGWLITYLVSMVCLIIVAYEIKCRTSAFETSGTSRTSEALKIIQTATLNVIIGFVYLAINLLIIFIVKGSQN